MKKIYLLVLFSSFLSFSHAQQCWQSIASGLTHTVALKADGTLWAWGFNGSGQLGDGTTTNRNAPVQIGTDTNWKFVTAGGNHSLAIKTDGTLWGWGDSLWGEVGTGTFGVDVLAPTRIGTASNWKSVAAGATFSLGVRTDGTLWAWGDNMYGQLGHGLYTAYSPVRVGTAVDWKSVTAGSNHTAALKTNNSLWIWGANMYGQLGNGTITDNGTPTQLGAAGEWKAVAAGNDHTLAIKADGSLWAWGHNFRGEIGNGTETNQLSPVKIGTSTWSTVAAGNEFSLAVNANGTLWSWGEVIGANWNETPYKTSPEQLGTATDWLSIAPGDHHAFGFRANGTVWFWGDNQWGELGTGDWGGSYNAPQMFSTGVPSGDATQTFCNGGTIADLKATGDGINWYTLPSGGTPAALSTALVNGAHYYASSTKYFCESASRLDVTVIINTTPTPAPPAPALQTFCSAASVLNLTATGTNVKWYATAAATTPLANTVALVNGTHYYVTQTVGSCESPRVDVTVSVNTTPAPTGSTAQNLCGGLTLGNLAVTGTSIKWYDAMSGGSALPASTVPTSGLHYYASQTLSGVESCRLDVLVTLANTPPPIGDATQILCYAGQAVSSLKATAISGNALWYDSPTGGNNVSSANVVNGRHYYGTQYANGCWSTTRLDVLAIINSTPIPTIQNNPTFCQGATLADLRVTGTALKWYDKSTGGQLLPVTTPLVNGTTYYVTQTIGGFESCGRPGLFVRVDANTAPDGPATQTFCNAATVANLTTVSSTYPVKWYGSATGADLLDASTPLVDGAHYYASRTVFNCESTNRLDVTVIINQSATPTPTGSSPQVVCGNTLRSVVVNGTGIKWYDSPTSTTALIFATTVEDGKHYYATQTIGACESAARLEVVVNYSPRPEAPLPVFDTDWQSAASNVWFSQNLAIKKDGTLWGWGDNTYGQVGGGTSNNTYTVPTPVNSSKWKMVRLGVAHAAGIKADGTLWAWGNIYARLNGQSTGVNITVPLQVGSATNWSEISAGGHHTLALKTDGTLWAWGYNANGQLGDGTYTDRATPVQIGTSNNWKAIVAGPDYSFALRQDGTLWYWGGLYLGGYPAEHPNYPVQVGTSQNWKSIATGSDTHFALQNDGSLWAWGNMTGDAYNNPQNGSTDALVPTRVGTQTDWKMVSVGGSHAMALKVDGTLWAIWGTNGDGQQGTGASPSYETWLLNPVQVGTSTDWQSVVAGARHTLALKNDGSLWACGLNDVGQLGVQPEKDYPSVDDHYVKTLRAVYSPLLAGACGTPTVGDLKASGTNIQWYASASGGTPLPPSTPLINGTPYYASQSNTTCESNWRLRVVGITIDLPAPTDGGTQGTSGTQTQTFCPGATVANLMASGSAANWYSVSSGGTPLSSATALVDGAHYYGTQSFNGCESTARLEMIVTIGTPGSPTGSAAQTFCGAATVEMLTATGAGVRWYSALSGGSLLPLSTVLVNGTHYYASQTVNGCESTARLDVLVSTGPGTPPSGSTTQQFCGSVSVSNLMATGTSLKWYNTSSGGTPLSLSTVLVNGTHYYASQTVNGCESSARLDVVVSVSAGMPPSGSTAQQFCGSASIANLVATGANLKWYSTSSGGSPLPLSTVLVNGTHYYASQTASGCESTARLDVLVSMGAGTPIGSTSQKFCDGATVANLVATGTNLKWYALKSGGTPMDPTTELIEGNHYYGTQTVGGCESQTRLDVTVWMSMLAPTGNAAQRYCSGATVSNLVATGTGIKWYSSQGGSVPLATDRILVNGLHYYASQTLNGCESQARLDVTVSIGSTAPTGDNTQIFCYAATVASLQVTGTSIKWYDVNVGGAPLAPATKLTSGAYYYAAQSIGGCESDFRFAVRVFVGGDAPTGSPVQSFCPDVTIAALTATGTGITWYSEPTDGTPLATTTKLVNGAHYYASQTTVGCASQTRLDVQVIVESPSTPTGEAIQSFCTAATVSNLAASGKNIVWYFTPTGGNTLASNSALTDGSTYYAAARFQNACESDERLAIQVNINPTPDAPSGDSKLLYKEGMTVNNLTATGSLLKWYASDADAQAKAHALSNTTAVIPGTTYFATQTQANCESKPFAVQVSLVTGVESMDSQLKVYPNPASDLLTITYSKVIDNITVTNAMGQVVINRAVKSSAINLDLSSLKSGYYFIDIKVKDVVIAHKVLKL